MTKKNQDIFNYLNDYIQGNLSDFAVFLKGSWGCGKTYFIKNWINKVQENKDLENFDIEIRPLYVSLYGLQNISEVSDAIRKSLHPHLNSKFVKTLKKVALQIGSVAIKYNLNSGIFNGDKEEMSVNLDLLDILSSDSTDVKLKGKKILVFDDFERCSIPKEELLGYINNFVEHSSCYIIIIGDDTRLNNVETLKFKRIKEKSIGREFTIEPDIESAINEFINEVGSTDLNLLNENKELIIDVFKASGINNLRILKHALYDYAQCISKLPNKNLIHEKSYNKILKTLLANFIMCYLELLSSETPNSNYKEDVEIDVGEKAPDSFSISKDEINNNDDSKKYIVGRRDFYKDLTSSLGVNIPNPGYCNLIIDYLNKGYFDIEALVSEIKIVIERPIEYLCNIYDVTDEGFNKYYPEVKEKYLSNEYNQLTDIYDGGIMLIYYSHQGLDNLTVEEIKRHACKMFKLDGMTLSQLHSIEGFIKNRSFYFSEIGIKKAVDDFSGTLKTLIRERTEKSKDDLDLYWENLGNSTIENIETMLAKSKPDHSTSYDNSSIFGSVDIEKLVSNIIKLSNHSLRLFTSSMIRHYNEFLRTSNAVDFVHYYANDIKPLKVISQRLKSYTFDIKASPITWLQIKELADRLEDYSVKIEEINKKAIKKP